MTKHTSAIRAWDGDSPPPSLRHDKAAQAAKQLIRDARLGPAMGTVVEERIRGLGRAQLALVVHQLFAELAGMFEKHDATI